MTDRKARWLGAASVVMALLVCFCNASFAWSPGPPPQAEHLKTVAATAVNVGRNAHFDEHSRLVNNDVNYVWRHCQKYMKPVGGVRDDSGSVVDYDVKMILDSVGQATCSLDPTTIFSNQTVHNLRTTAGGDWQASVMGNTAAPPATCNFIALSNDATAPAVGDTVVAGEIAANGLSRAQGTYAHTNGTASFTVQKVFSATGTQASQKAGLLNASSTGTLCFENTYTTVTVNNGDTLTVTWTINY